MTTADNLRERRQALGISAVDLSIVIGMHGAGLSRIESGNVDCRESTLNRISAGLDTIEQNRIAKERGAIILNKIDFRNAAFNAILTKLHTGQWEFAEYNDNELKNMANILVTAVYEGLTKAEE